jgi:hypothetical protein
MAAARTNPLVQTASAVASPVAADANGAATVSSDNRSGTRRTQLNSEHLPSRWLTQLLDQRLIELHKLTGPDELSFTEIAWRLNDEFSMHMSRNAVIGRANRMHLPARPTFKRNGRPVKVVAKKLAVTFVKKIKPKPAAPAKPRNLSLLQLQHHDCRYATAGAEAPYLYCGNPVVETTSWCPIHFKLVHAGARPL